MKRLLSLLLVLCLLLPSCGRKGGIDNIKNKVNEGNFDDYLTPETTGDLAEPMYDYAPEEVYRPQEADMDGIVGELFYDNKFYYEVRTEYNRNQHYTGISIMAYTDLATGEKKYLCPDPLCTHAEEWECSYVNRQPNYIQDGYMYGHRFLYSDNALTTTHELWRINLTDSSIEPLTSVTSEHEKGITRNISNINHGVADGKLYFEKTTRTSDEEQREETTVKELWALDLATGTEHLVAPYPEGYRYIVPYAIYGGELFLNSDRGIYVSDLDFGNLRQLTEEDGLVRYYDSNTGEVFLHTNFRIYVYKDGVVTPLNLPCDDVYTFQITNHKIYYSPYDLLVYGTGVRGGQPVGDETGGKIYAIPRNLSGEPELIYDGGQEFMLTSPNGSYMVFGDHLYLPYFPMTDYGNGTIAFSVAIYRKWVRLDLKEYTIKYMRFD